MSFLYSLERFGILLGLENITSLLGQLGNPQDSFCCIHVAGSNGKGSTASYISNIAQRAGLKTALYTSPHLNDFRERIRINGQMVSKESLVTAAHKIRELYDPQRTTFFEFTTAVAFECMAQATPDLAIVEVGLGGRLDATNVLQPDVTVITDISREHEDYLGEGITAIAREKAGILKHAIPLVTGASRKEARAVILETARRLSVPAKEFGRDFRGLRVSQNSFTYQSESHTLEKLTTGMTGAHQIKNASLAIAVAEEMIKKNYPITIDAIRKGIEGTCFPGRFEVLRIRPDVVIDGAHTLEGMRLLKSSFMRIYPQVKPFMLLGMLKDKNYLELVKIIASIAREVVCVPPQGNRALDPHELAAHVRERGVQARAFGDIAQGFDQLMGLAGPEDVVLATGSLYMIGPVRRACGVSDE